jgi:hypothetical protein
MQTSPTHHLLRRVAILLLLLLLSSLIHASSGEESTAEKVPSIEDQIAQLQTQLKQLNERIAAAVQAVTEEHALQLGVTVDDLKLRVEVLQGRKITGVPTAMARADSMKLISIRPRSARLGGRRKQEKHSGGEFQP